MSNNTTQDESVEHKTTKTNIHTCIEARQQLQNLDTDVDDYPLKETCHSLLYYTVVLQIAFFLAYLFFFAVPTSPII